MSENANLWHPVWVAPGHPAGDDCIDFELTRETVRVAGPNPDLLWRVLAESTGAQSSQQIVARLTQNGIWRTSDVVTLLNTLRELTIVADAGELYLSFHELTKNPMLYQATPRRCAQQPSVSLQGVIASPDEELAPLGSSRSRRSCRSFANAPVDALSLFRILRDSYGRDHQVPSAGALYPIGIEVIVLVGDGTLQRGVYRCSDDGTYLRSRNIDIERTAFEHALDSDDLVFGAPVMFVLSADFSKTTWKYGNRGYRYALLEAGHVAQNLLLSATSMKLATIEYGGFLDDALSRLLKLETCEPLLVVGLGHESSGDPPCEDVSQTLASLRSTAVFGQLRVSTRTGLAEDGLASDFFISTANTVRDAESGRTIQSSGVARTSRLSEVKARSEALERYLCEKPRVDVRACPRDLDLPFLPPDTIMPYSAEQRDRLQRISAFRMNDEYDWIYGQDPDGGVVLVPCDLVFYGCSDGERDHLANASSSGVAVHTSRSAALRIAVLELIERDAIMRAWIGKQSPPIAHDSALSARSRRRINYWKHLGRRVYILSLVSEWAHVALAVAFCPDYPSFVCGAAADFESFEEAADRALLELEGILYLNLGGASRSDRATRMASPMDHFQFYSEGSNAAMIEWLIEGPVEVPTAKRRESSASLRDKLRVATVDLSPSSNRIFAIRALSPELVPVTFGVGAELYSHKRVARVRANSMIGRYPHFFS